MLKISTCTYAQKYKSDYFSHSKLKLIFININ